MPSLWNQLLLTLIVAGADVGAGAAEPRAYPHGPAMTGTSSSPAHLLPVTFEKRAPAELDPLQRRLDFTPAAERGLPPPPDVSPGRSLVVVGGSLMVVLGVFFVVAWLSRRGMTGASQVLPADVVEVVGRATLAGRQQMHLVRLGSKLVLISVMSNGAETLAEVTDVDEVNRLLGLCRQTQSGSVTRSFQEVFRQLSGNGEHTAEIESGMATETSPGPLRRMWRRKEFHG